jgi:hypothetical protein
MRKRFLQLARLSRFGYCSNSTQVEANMSAMTAYGAVLSVEAKVNPRFATASI